MNRRVEQGLSASKQVQRLGVTLLAVTLNAEARCVPRRRFASAGETAPSNISPGNSNSCPGNIGAAAEGNDKDSANRRRVRNAVDLPIALFRSAPPALGSSRLLDLDASGPILYIQRLDGLPATTRGTHPKSAAPTSRAQQQGQP
jgi:hypothetical protein